MTARQISLTLRKKRASKTAGKRSRFGLKSLGEFSLTVEVSLGSDSIAALAEKSAGAVTVLLRSSLAHVAALRRPKKITATAASAIEAAMTVPTLNGPVWSHQTIAYPNAPESRA